MRIKIEQDGWSYHEQAAVNDYIGGYVLSTAMHRWIRGYSSLLSPMFSTPKEIVMPEEYPATFLVYILPEDIPWTRDGMGRADKFAPQNPAKNGATAGVKEAAAFSNVKIDNSTGLETLDMHEYPLWTLELFFNDLQKIKRIKDGSDAIAHTVEEVNQKFPIQIVRKNANAYYTIYKVKEGGYYYVFFTDAYEIYKGLDLQGLVEVGIVPVEEKKTVSDTYYPRNLVILPQSYHVSLHATACHNYVTESLRPVAGDKAGIEATLAPFKAEILARSAAGIRWD